MLHIAATFSHAKPKPEADENAVGLTDACAAAVHRGGASRAKLKVLMYSHDTFGLGHLRRSLAIAERLLNFNGMFSVRLLTGSPVIQNWSLPRGLRVQALPAVVKTGAEEYAPRASAQMYGMVKGYREALILKTVLRYRPDVFLVDHAPAGMNGELLSTLALIRGELPDTRTIIGLRDILDSPDIVRKTWRDQDIYSLLEQAYDDIFVYGSRNFFDVAEQYELPAALARRVRYCGHVVSSPAVCEVSARSVHPKDRPLVLVTAGGGGDGFFLMDAYLRALEHLPLGTLHSRVVTGPLMAGEQSAILHRRVGGRRDVELIDYTTDLVPSLRAADLVVSMAGYNTSAEILALRKRAILVPRAAPRAEQRLRAALLARLGVVWSIDPEADLATRLAALIPVSLASPVRRNSDPAAIDLNGAERVAHYLSSPSAASGMAAEQLR